MDVKSCQPFIQTSGWQYFQFATRRFSDYSKHFEREETKILELIRVQSHGTLKMSPFFLAASFDDFKRDCSLSTKVHFLSCHQLPPPFRNVQSE